MTSLTRILCLRSLSPSSRISRTATGRVEDGREDRVLALLDALGDLDLALAGEQRDGAHLAQVHADRVVRLGVVVVAPCVRASKRRSEPARGRRPRCRRLGLGLGRRVFFRAAVRRDLHLAGVVDDLDVLVVERGQHVVHLIGTDVLARQRFVHLVVGEEALGLAQRDQLLFGFSVGLRRRRKRRADFLVVVVVVVVIGTFGLRGCGPILGRLGSRRLRLLFGRYRLRRGRSWCALLGGKFRLFGSHKNLSLCTAAL